MTEKKNDPFDLSAGVPQIEGELRPKPRLADRISKRVIAVALIIVGLLMAIFLISIDQIDNKPVKKDENKVTKKASIDEGVKGAPADVLGDENSKGEVKPATLVPHKEPDPVPEKENATKTGAMKDQGATRTKEGNVPPLTGNIPPNSTGGAGAANAQLTPEQQAEQQAKQERMAQMRQARTNGLTAKPFAADTTAKTAAATDAIKTVLEQAGKQAAGGSGLLSEQKRTMDGEQDEKLNFIKESSKDNTAYHPYMPVAAISKNEVKAGSFIPMTLQQGINSDLPGEVTARVTEGVYDTTEGCRLLIPPLTTVKGKYDSKVAIGQNRVLVVWNNMIFPDGEELNLAGMQSYDTAGMTGMESEVDNHYLRLFGVGLGMSLVSAGTQLALPDTQTTNSSTPNYSQTVSSALAQQFGQLGGQLMGKYAAVQPTLRNYVGEKFVIMVPRTIVFSKVWRNRCSRVANN